MVTEAENFADLRSVYLFIFIIAPVPDQDYLESGPLLRGSKPPYSPSVGDC